MPPPPAPSTCTRTRVTPVGTVHVVSLACALVSAGRGAVYVRSKEAAIAGAAVAASATGAAQAAPLRTCRRAGVDSEPVMGAFLVTAAPSKARRAITAHTPVGAREVLIGSQATLLIVGHSRAQMHCAHDVSHATDHFARV